MASSSSQPQQNNDSRFGYQEKKQYMLLHKAAVTGDWESAKKLFEEDEDLITARITEHLVTALHIAVGTGNAIHFIEKLVEMLQPDAMTLQTAYGYTALHTAAIGGSTKAAVILIKKTPSLLYIKNNRDFYPIHEAALSAQREILLYLFSEHVKPRTEHHVEPSPLENESGALLLVNLIDSGFLDVAVDLVHRYPYLAALELKTRPVHPLLAIARKVDAFPSGSSLNFWQRFIYSCVPMNLENYDNNPNGSDIENPVTISQTYTNIQSADRVFQKLQLMFWKFSELLDNKRNSILHLAGYLAPPHKLNLVSGAALQMQCELQWFKEVEKFLNPASRQWKNSDGRTAAMVFSKEHEDLVIEGGKWMKNTANSCTIAAALIATVVFAAAINVPGGNHQESGLPIFSKESAFILFAVSDAISLFTSTASLLMFLSILTSRYAEADFLYALPKRLIIGLLTLFLSITSMMIAFSATLYLVFFKNTAWVVIPVATLACLPVTLFVFLQFPLLVDVISSTYGPGIFGKQSDRPLY